MEPLSLLRLSSPKRPHPHSSSSGYYNGAQTTASELSCSGSAFSTPYTSAPSSPGTTTTTSRVFFFREEHEAEEAPLGEVRAAVPFLWEEVPGTPRRDQAAAVRDFAEPVQEEEEEEEYGAHDQSIREDYSFEFFAAGARQIAPAAHEEVLYGSDQDAVVSADELFFKGRVLPLRLPPRLLQSPKPSSRTHPPTSDSSCSDDSSSGSETRFNPKPALAQNSLLPETRFDSKPALHLAGSCAGLRSSSCSSSSKSRSLLIFLARSCAGQQRTLEETTELQADVVQEIQLMEDTAAAEAILEEDFSFTDQCSSSSSAAEKYSSSGYEEGSSSLLKDLWPQLKEEEEKVITGMSSIRQGKWTELHDVHRHPTDRTNVKEHAPQQQQLGGMSLLGTGPVLQKGLQASSSQLAEIDKSSVMKKPDQEVSTTATAVQSFKESAVERLNSRLRITTSGRYPLLPRKLKLSSSSSSSRRSAVSPPNLHLKPFPLYQIRRTLFWGCLGSTPTTEEQEFSDIFKSPTLGLRSQKVL